MSGIDEITARRQADSDAEQEVVTLKSMGADLDRAASAARAESSVDRMLRHGVTLAAFSDTLMHDAADLAESDHPVAALGPAAAQLVTMAASALTSRQGAPAAWLGAMMCHLLIKYKDMTAEEAGDLWSEMVAGEGRREFLVELATEAIEASLGTSEG